MKLFLSHHVIYTVDSNKLFYNSLKAVLKFFSLFSMYCTIKQYP
jgi:hypothetical protein